MNINIEIIKDTVLDKEIEEGTKFIISSPQLKILNQYFSKQLDYVIGKSDTKEIVKLLDILKSIEKNKI